MKLTFDLLTPVRIFFKSFIKMVPEDKNILVEKLPGDAWSQLLDFLDLSDAKFHWSFVEAFWFSGGSTWPDEYGSTFEIFPVVRPVPDIFPGNSFAAQVTNDLKIRGTFKRRDLNKAPIRSLVNVSILCAGYSDSNANNKIYTRLSALS